MPTQALVIMGVAGSGKTTIGTMLAARLGWLFADADRFHPQSNIDKMSAGIPLTDEDRIPWLDSMRTQMQLWVKDNKKVVLACSALKASYRERLGFDKFVAFVYLKGDFKLFEERLLNRQQHYMKSNMLSSQFQALEEPDDALVIDAAAPPDSIVEKVIEELRLSRP